MCAGGPETSSAQASMRLCSGSSTPASTRASMRWLSVTALMFRDDIAASSALRFLAKAVSEWTSFHFGQGDAKLKLYIVPGRVVSRLGDSYSVE